MKKVSKPVCCCIIIGLFILWSPAISAQESDTSKINTLFKQAMEIRLQDSVLANQYANKMLQLSQKSNFTKGQARAYYLLGRMAHDSNNHEKAVTLLKKSVLLSAEAGDQNGILNGYYWMARCYRRIADYPKYQEYLLLLENKAVLYSNKEYLSYAYEGYGNLYRYLGDYPQSLDYYMKAINISEDLGNLEDLSLALNNMSLVYEYQEKYEEELKIQMRNYEILKQLDDKEDLVLCLSNISAIYNNLGDKEKSKEFVQKAIRIIEQEGPDNIEFKSIGSAYVQYAERAIDDGDFEKGMHYHNRNLELNTKYKDVKGISNAYGNIARVYHLMGQNDKAKEYYLIQLAIANDIGFLNGKLSAYQSLTELTVALNDYREAYLYQQEYLYLKDSVEIQANSQQMERIDAWFKIKEQQQQIELLSKDKAMNELEMKKQNTIFYAMSGGFLLLLIVAVIVFRNYRKLKRAEKQLLYANQELESFSYSVSHDLRAPLRAIGNYAVMIQEDYGNELGQEGNRYLNVVKDNTEKMNQLIEGLLAFSKLGKQRVSLSSINMNEMVERVINELRKSLHFQTEIRIGELHSVKGDPVLINQVLVNLISNSIKYSSKSASPVVEITAEKNGHEIVYSIKDNGVGFEMQYADKLFGVFQRLHSSEEFEGTGVGLAIVQRIVNKHGGKIWAVGEQDKGAVFHFSLLVN